MTPHYADPWLTVYQGDARAVLADLPAESVHCVVTSPPYFGLRDYGTASWEGGDPGCDHLAGPLASAKSGLQGGKVKDTDKIRTNGMPFKDVCGRCGARRQDSQLGLEPTPEEYVTNLVAVFREVRRVLRADGTVWLNLGDSYASGTVGRNDEDEANLRRRFETYGTGRPKAGRGGNAGQTRPLVTGLKPKDLVGIPWRVAFALQADGWYLRSDIVWSKPNPMPESVTDRPTKSHEYLFLLSKRATYYYDADAVREQNVTQPRRWISEAVDARRIPGQAPQSPGITARKQASVEAGARNLRSVWTVATQPYPGAHFATFPRKLVEPCIKAGTSERGVCPECGAPWERVTQREGGERYATGKSEAKNRVGLATAFSGYTDGSSAPTFITTGWRPTCTHVSPRRPEPATILDPFAGSGTTGMVAQSLSRRAVLIDLSMDYLGQLMERNRDVPLGLGA